MPTRQDHRPPITPKFPYFILAGKEGDEKKPQLLSRRIVLINGIPFYSSRGNSPVGGMSNISPAWRKDLWMPILGMNTVGSNALSKLGESLSKEEHIGLSNFLKGILNDSFNKLKERNSVHAFAELKKLMTQTAVTLYSTEQEAPKAQNDVLGDLAEEMIRFGGIEAMIISMKISPDQWATNSILKDFMDTLLKMYPAYAFYDAMNLPEIIQNAELEAFVEADQDKPEASRKAANSLNNWLLNELSRPENALINPQISRKGETIGFILGALATVSGGLILGEVLNIGVLAGSGGLILAGISTAAALTGFGLILLALVGVMAACLCLRRSSVKRANYDSVIDEQNITRSAIKQFLNANNTNATTPVNGNVILAAENGARAAHVMTSTIADQPPLAIQPGKNKSSMFGGSVLRYLTSCLGSTPPSP